MPLRELKPSDVAGTLLPENIVDRTPKPEGSVWGAAFRREFVPASLATFASGNGGELSPVEREASYSYDYKEDMPPEYADYEEEYAKYATSQRKAQWVTEGIRQRLDDDAVIDNSGAMGVIASGFAAMTSPEQWPTYVIPGAILMKAGVMTGSRAAIIGTEMTVATGGAVVSEVMLGATQAPRTDEEAVFAVAGSAIFAGLITAGIVNYKGVKRSFSETAADIDGDMKIMDGDKRMDEMIDDQSMGAALSKADVHERHRRLLERAENDVTAGKAANDQPRIDEAQGRVDELSNMKPEELTKLKHPKLAKVLGFIAPAVRLAGSRVSSARDISAMLVDDSISRVANKYGGEIPMSIESNMKVFEIETNIKTQDAIDSTYLEYKKVTKENGEKAVPRIEFSRMVGEAMTQGDKHADKLVEKAAKAIRSEVTEPIQTRLDAQDLLDREVVDYGVITRDDLIETELFESVDEIDNFFKKDGTPKASMGKMPSEVRDLLVAQGKLKTRIRKPKGDETYLHRLWDFEAIRLDSTGFEKRVADYFHDKATDAIFENTVGALNTKIAKLEAKMNALDARVKKSKNKKREKINERTYAESQAEIAVMEAERKALRDAGDTKGASKIKRKKRSNAQKAHDLRQEVNHLKDVEVPKAKAKYDRDVLSARGDADKMGIAVRNAIAGEEFDPSVSANRIARDVGPLKARTLDIPSNYLNGFVEKDVEKVMQRYVQGVNAQLHFKETFAPSSPSAVKVGKDPQAAGIEAFGEQMNKIKDEYDTLARTTETGIKNEDGSWKVEPNNKEAMKIRKEWKAVKRDTKAMQLQLFGKYKLPDNPSGFWNQARQRLRELNMMTMLGFMTVSAIPDMGNYIMRRGMKSFARDMYRLATNMKTMKMSAKMWRRAGISVDLQSSGRVEKMYLMDDQAAPISTRTTGGKIKRAWKNTQEVFTKATLMPMWNNMLKSTAATSIIDDIAIDALRLTQGKLSRSAISEYARAGLSEDTLEAIAKNLNKKRDLINGVWIPNVDEWADQDLAMLFKASVRKEVDMTVVTPGTGDLPLGSRGELGKMIFQFKSFAMAANQRVLLAGLDDFNANKVAGMIMMTTLGYISYAARQTLKGKDFDTDYDTFVREGLDRSGMLGIWGELNAMASKLTTGELDMYRALGAEKATLSRYASRNLLGAILGVSAGRVADVGKIASALASGDYSESDIRAVRRLLIMNNLWFTHRAFTQIEKSLGGAQ